jgi:uncharacterized DUF497 family protein
MSARSRQRRRDMIWDDTMPFRWNDWNLEHISAHGIDRDEAALVVKQARPPYPTGRDQGKYLVIGPGRGGRSIQVIYVLDEDGTYYVIHARPISDREKRRYRRRRK